MFDLNTQLSIISSIVIITGSIFGVIKFLIMPFLSLCKRLLVLETQSKYYDMNLEKNLVSVIHDHLTPIEDSYFDRYDALNSIEQKELILLLQTQVQNELELTTKKVCLIQLISFLNYRINLKALSITSKKKN